MATITKKIDGRIEPAKKYQYWASSENADDGTVIAAADIFMIETSLGRPAKYVYIETAATTDLSIRLNSQVTVTPIRAANVNYPRWPAIEDSEVITDDTMAAIPIGAAEVWEFTSIIPVSDIQIVAFSTGSFELFVA